MPSCGKCGGFVGGSETICPGCGVRLVGTVTLEAPSQPLIAIAVAMLAVAPFIAALTAHKWPIALRVVIGGICAVGLAWAGRVLIRFARRAR